MRKQTTLSFINNKPFFSPFFLPAKVRITIEEDCIDLFKTNKDVYIVHADDLTLRQNYYNDTRSLALILSYNFGKSTIKKQRDRDTEFQNVKNRIV